MKKRKWYKLILFFIISLLLEVFVMNGRVLFTTNATNQQPEYFMDGNTLHIRGMRGEPGYVYVDVSAVSKEGTQVPIHTQMWIQDQGQSDFYELPQATIYPLVEKSKYLRVYSYGAVHGMYIRLETNVEADIQVNGVVYDARVPLFVSKVRVVAFFVMLCLIWCLRPKSSLYHRDWSSKQKKVVTLALIVANSLVFLVLVRSNPAFVNPVWPYHQQYHQLAVSLTQGKVSIEMADERTQTALRELDNPYDSDMRMKLVPNAGNIWDVCYYEDSFYVYFGIVPVLFFYLPYYVLVGSAFPTWLGVFLAGVAAVAGSFYLLWQIRRKWFPQLNYTWYLLLAVLLSNCLNISCAMLRADFYYLPILMALAFTLWGLGIFLGVTTDWKQASKKSIESRLVVGALCMALTAGCRPQFLVGSFLLIPLFWPILSGEKDKKQLVCRGIAVAIPYVVVAAGLMFYNYIRFDSVLDFGANYNLTTNDMTHRGMHPGRFQDGLFMYLFQPINCGWNFPFAQITDFHSQYLGSTIRDWTFGGALWTHPILLFLPAVWALKDDLARKKLYGFSMFSMGLAVLVVLADTQLAGILNRYYTDFLWLLVIPLAIVLMQLLVKYQVTKTGRWIGSAILIVGAFSVFYEMVIGMQSGELMAYNAHRYYLIQSMFQ